MQKVRERTSALEGRVGSLEDEFAPVRRDVLANHGVVQRHANRIDDMENRLRRNNIRILGLPVEIQWNLSNWLFTTFEEKNFTPFFVV